ncbi:MAG: hypothetical protein LBM67_09150 [Lentimicrobiaceae bacterium]|jgi:hypothetical protein|nr:hypothetical protein [Lentimicrobiaceae bacterium]
MNFDFGAVLAKMLTAMKNVFLADWGNVRATSEKFMQEHEESLQRLTDDRLNKRITEEEYEQYLRDEFTILEAQIKALKVVRTATTQKAINAALEVLERAIKGAITL